MSDDVLITPASRKIEFKDSSGNIDGKIELDGSGNLQITSTGLIGIGDTSEDIHIGDGTQAVDLVFDYTSRLYSVANQDLTIGKSSLGGNDIVIDSPNWSVSSAGVATLSDLTLSDGKVEITQSDGSEHGLKVYRNDDTTSTPLVYFHDDHAYNDSAVLHVKTDRADQYGYAAFFEGKVGINTTSPSTTLHVAKAGTNELTVLTLDNGLDTDGGRSVGMDFRVRYASTNIATSYIGFDYYGTKLTSDSHGLIYRSGRAGFAHHHFVADDNTRQMMIADNGEVGIGSSFTHAAQPDAKLHLKGSGGGEKILIEDTGSDSNPALEIKNDAVHWKLQARGGDSDNFRIVEDSTTHAIIDTSGRLVVGATSASLTTANHGVIEVCGSTQANFRATDTSGSLHTDFAHSGNDTYIMNRVAAGKIYIKPGNGDHSIELASNGQVKFNDAYTFPTSDGSANQVLQTNGSGALSFATVSGGGGSLDADTNLASNPEWTVTSTSGVGLYLVRDKDDSNSDQDLFRIREHHADSDQAALYVLNDGGAQMNQQDFGRCFTVGAQSTGEGVTYPLQVVNGRNASSNYAGVGIKFKLSGWGNSEEGRKFSSIHVVSQTSWSRKHKMVFKVYGSASSNQDVDTAMTIKDNLEIDGNFNDTSDRALKSNIKTIPNGLGMIEKLNPVTFNWDVKVNNQPSAGFIAQEVEEVLPDLVNGIEGEKTIKTAGIVGYLVKAVQELSARVKELEGGN